MEIAQSPDSILQSIKSKNTSHEEYIKDYNSQIYEYINSS